MNRQEYEDGIRELYNGIGKAKMSPYKDPRFQGYMKQIEDLGFDMTRPAIRNMATTMFIVIDMEERENEHIYKDVLLVFETIRSEGKKSSAKCFSVLRRYIDDLITELKEETLAEYVYPITKYSDLIDELEKYEDEHPGEISDKEITRILSTKGTTRNVRKSGEEREKRDKEASAKGELNVYKLKKEINLDEYMEKLRENGWDTEKDRGLIEFVYKNDYEALSTSDNEDTVKSRIKGIREFEENGSAGPVAKMKLVENMEDVFTGTQFEEEYKGLADLYKRRAFREDPDYYKGEKSQFRTRVVITKGWEDVDTLKNAEKFFDFLFDAQLSGAKMAFVPSVVQVCKELENNEIKKEKRVYDEDNPSEYEIQEVVDTEIVKSVIEKIRAAILEIPENELTLPQIEVVLTIIEDFGESGKNDSMQHFLELKEAVKSGKVISTTEKSADKKAEQEAAEKARKEEEERKKAEEEKKRREEEEAKIRFEEEKKKKAEEAKKAEEEKKRREEEDKKAEEDKLRQKRREERKKRTYPKSYQNQKEYEDGVKDLLERFADIDTDFMDKDGLEDYLEEAQKAGLDVNNPGIRNIIIILNDSDNAVLKENKNIKRNDLRNSEIEGLFNHFGTNMMSLSSKKRYKGRRDTKYDKFLEEYKEAEPLMTVIAKFENRLHLGASKKALDSLKLKAGEISDIKDTDKDNLTEYEKKARSILEGLSKERRKELAGKKYTDDITYDDFVQKAFLNGWELEKDLPFLELVFEKFTKLPKKTDGDKYNGVTSTVVSIFNSKAKTYRFKARVAVHAGNTTGMPVTFDDFANYYRREAVNDYLTRNDESVYKEAARAGWKEESDKEFIDALKIQYNKDIRNRKGESAIPDPNQKKQMGIPQKYDDDMKKLVKFFFGVFKTPKEKLDYLKAINRANNNLVTEHRALAIYDKTVARYEEIVNPGLNSGNVIHDGQEDINAQKEADKKHIEEENRRREEEKARKEKEEAERRKAEEDAKKAEEERVRREEEERKRLEEEKLREQEELKRKHQEENENTINEEPEGSVTKSVDVRKMKRPVIEKPVTEIKLLSEDDLPKLDAKSENVLGRYTDLMAKNGWTHRLDRGFFNLMIVGINNPEMLVQEGDIGLKSAISRRNQLYNLYKTTAIKYKISKDNDRRNFMRKFCSVFEGTSLSAIYEEYNKRFIQLDEYSNNEKFKTLFITSAENRGWKKVAAYKDYQANVDSLLQTLYDAKFTDEGIYLDPVAELCDEITKVTLGSKDEDGNIYELDPYKIYESLCKIENKLDVIPENLKNKSVSEALLSVQGFKKAFAEKNADCVEKYEKNHPEELEKKNKKPQEEERKHQEEDRKAQEEEDKKSQEEENKRLQEEEERKRIAEEERKRFEDEKFRNTPSMRLIPGKEKKETKAEIKSDKDFDEAVTELYDRINNYMEFNIPKVEGQDEFIKEVEKAGFDTSIPAVKKLLLVFHAKTVVTDKKGVADNILKKIKDTKKGSYFKSLSAILSKLDEVSRNFDPILHDTGAINAANSIKGLLKNIEKYEPGLKDYDEKVIREGKITAPKELSQKEEEQPKAEEKIQKAEEKIQKAEGSNKQADDGQIFETYKNGIKEILDKIQMLVIKSEYPGLEITKEKFNKLGLDVKTPGMEKLVILVNNLTHKKLIEDEIDAHVYTAMEDELKNKKALPAELLETIFDNLTNDCGDRFTSIKCQAAKDKAAELAKYEKQHLEVIKAALKKEAQEKKKGSERKEDKEKESAQPQKKENPIKQKQPEGMQEKDYFEDEDEENNINNINNINTSTKKTTADKNKKNDDDIPADKKKAIEYAKKYDQFMAVKQSMLEGLKSFKEGIINNAQKDKKLYRNLATMSDEQKTEAFLKDGSVYYRRMAKALEDCIKLLESGECHEGKIYKQFFELENRAIQYQEYNKPLLSPASHEYKTGSGKIRYRIAENFEMCAGMWRMEYSYLNRELLTLSGGGKKYATDEAKRQYAAELKDKYQLETEDMTEEQLKEYSKVSSLRSQFVNKVANDGFKEIIRFYAHYSHNRSADEYLTVVGAPDSIDKKAAWFVFKQEIDKIFAEDITADEISKIIKSYSPERLKAKISRLKKDKVFKEVCTKNETSAFSKWEDIDLDSRKAAYAIKKTISTKTERLSGCFPLDAHLVNDVREMAATIIAESIMSKPENAEIIHRAYAAENGKQEVLNDIQQLKFIASGYLRRKDLIKTDGSVTIANVAEKILYNDSIQKAILKEYHSKKKAAESKKNIDDIRLDGSQNEKNPVNMINDININTNANMAPTFDLNKEKNNIIE